MRRNQAQIDRRNFPRAEYELVRASDPKTLHRLSPARLNKYIQRCERLIDSYGIRLGKEGSLKHVWRGSKSLDSTRLIRYRMSHLSTCLRKFRSELRKSVSPAPSIESHSMTSQPKMKISRRNGGRGAAQVRERQRRASSPDNTVNPSSRGR